MFIHGVTTITSYYGENLLPDPEMCEFCEHVSSLTSLFEGSRYHVNTFLYYPYENLCADRTPQGVTEGSDSGEDHLGIGKTSARLMKHQVAFDFINKKSLLSCKICDGHLISSNGELVECVVIPNISWVDCEVAEFLKEARKNGIKVLFDTEYDTVENVDFTVEHLTEHNYPSLIRLYAYDPYIITMRRDFNGYSLVMLMNTDESSLHDLSVNIDLCDGEKLYEIDLKAHIVASHIERTASGIFNFSVPALDSVIIAIVKSNG